MAVGAAEALTAANTILSATAISARSSAVKGWLEDRRLNGDVQEDADPSSLGAEGRTGLDRSDKSPNSWRHNNMCLVVLTVTLSMAWIDFHVFCFLSVESNDKGLFLRGCKSQLLARFNGRERAHDRHSECSTSLEMEKIVFSEDE